MTAPLLSTATPSRPEAVWNGFSMPMQSDSAAVLGAEITAILIRHLPTGMEGIGAAQSRAVMEVLSRSQMSAIRPALPDDTRDGLRMLRDVALGHRASSVLASAEGRRCTVCRSTPTEDDFAVWPCPVWTAAHLCGVVGTEDDDFEVGGDSTITLTVEPAERVVTRSAQAAQAEQPAEVQDEPAAAEGRRKRRLLRR